MDGSLPGTLADAPAPRGEGPLPAYRNRVAAGNLRPDPAQEAAAERLQDLWQRIRGYDPKPLAEPASEGGGLLGRLFRRKAAAEALPEALAARETAPRQRRPIEDFAFFGGWRG